MNLKGLWRSPSKPIGYQGRELFRHLEQHGCVLLSEVGNHTRRLTTALSAAA
jgi:hypothetical protein